MPAGRCCPANRFPVAAVQRKRRTSGAWVPSRCRRHRRHRSSCYDVTRRHANCAMRCAPQPHWPGKAGRANRSYAHPVTTRPAGDGWRSGVAIPRLDARMQERPHGLRHGCALRKARQDRLMRPQPLSPRLIAALCAHWNDRNDSPCYAIGYPRGICVPKEPGRGDTASHRTTARAGFAYWCSERSALHVIACP